MVVDDSLCDDCQMRECSPEETIVLFAASFLMCRYKTDTDSNVTASMPSTTITSVFILQPKQDFIMEYSKTFNKF